MAGVYTNGRGYEEIRPCGREGASQGVLHHRILAWAWGVGLDGLDDPREVDHRTEVPWLNTEANLRPLAAGEHSRRTRARERARRATAGGRQAALSTFTKCDR